MILSVVVLGCVITLPISAQTPVRSSLGRTDGLQRTDSSTSDTARKQAEIPKVPSATSPAFDQASDSIDIAGPKPWNPMATSNTSAPVSIGPGDLVEVRVFEAPELTGRVRVNDKGNVNLPLVGELHFGGLSPELAAKLVEEKLVSGDFVKNPQVSIFMNEYASQGVAAGPHFRGGRNYRARRRHNLNHSSRRA
jgi:hypothetical protein